MKVAVRQLLIKRIISALILILSVFLCQCAYTADLKSLEIKQKELSELNKTDLTSVVFFSEYDFIFDTNLYYNPEVRKLTEKLSEANKHWEQSNVAVSYFEYKKILETMKPNDFYYMLTAYKLAQSGFFSLSHIAMNKINDKEIWASHIETVRKNFFPKVNLKVQEEVFFAELLSDIIYNNMTNESLIRLSKSESELANSDYGSYIKSKAYFADKKQKQALSAINNALEQNSDNINYLKFKAEILNSEGKVKEALNILNKIPEQDLLYIENQKSTEKIKYYTLTNLKNNTDIQKYNLAYYFYLNRDYQRAVNELKLMLIRGKSELAGKLLGHIYLINGEYKEAEKLYKKLLLKSPKSAYAHKGLGDIYLNENRKALAYAEYKNALKYEPNNVENYVGYIVAGVEIGDIKTAKKYLTKAKTKFPTNYKILYLNSQINEDRGKQNLKNSLKYNPFYPEGWLDLAGEALEHRDTVSAEEYINTAAFITKNSARYFYYKSILNKEKKEYETAEKDIARAKELYLKQKLKRNQSGETNEKI